jgi:hypothetical protein
MGVQQPIKKTAAITGGLGDIVYSLQVCKALDVGILYVKCIELENDSNTFDAIKKIVLHNDITPVPVDGSLPMHEFPPGLNFDYNLDDFRRQPRRGVNHILLSFRNQFGLKYDYKLPWLKPVDHANEYCECSIISVTPRWRDGSMFDWNNVLAKDYMEPFYFIGFESDYRAFCKRYRTIPYIRTENLFEAMRVISSCKTLFCNQNPMLAIAQGLGDVNYFCEFKPGKTNTRLFKPTEHNLNDPRTRI